MAVGCHPQLTINIIPPPMVQGPSQKRRQKYFKSQRDKKSTMRLCLLGELHPWCSSIMQQYGCMNTNRYANMEQEILQVLLLGIPAEHHLHVREREIPRWSCTGGHAPVSAFRVLKLQVQIILSHPFVLLVLWVRIKQTKLTFNSWPSQPPTLKYWADRLVPPCLAF